MLPGLAVSIVGGWAVVTFFVWFVRWKWIGQPEQRTGIPGWLTGIMERGIFTFLVAYEVDAIGAVMAGWLALKLASNWNRPGYVDPKAPAFAFAALLAGLLSLGFAALGGRIALGAGLWW